MEIVIYIVLNNKLISGWGPSNDLRQLSLQLRSPPLPHSSSL